MGREPGNSAFRASMGNMINEGPEGYKIQKKKKQKVSSTEKKPTAERKQGHKSGGAAKESNDYSLEVSSPGGGRMNEGEGKGRPPSKMDRMTNRLLS